MPHPTPQQLADFGRGKLPERDMAAVAAHLASCSACRKAVNAVSPDSFLDKVRAAGRGDASFPPGLAQPPNTPTSAGEPVMAVVPCPNVPPELASHSKYLILRELNRGGMGVVYQARQTMMNRQVVIKVISRSLIERPDSLQRFQREIQAAAQLSHPNIVTAYDAEQAGELHMLVMEFVPGQSLAEVLEKRGPLPVAHACHYMRQVALGLQHAHERGMVHRDIKPGNLMLSLKNQIKILDFGLAKVVSERDKGKGITVSDACMGTPEYMAPEQAKNAAKADIRADLYSLGCTLYCLLAGRPPYREDTWMNTVLAHIQKQPQPLTELRPDVPAKLWQVVAKLLAKEPAQRYQKPIEVVQALAPFVKPESKSDAKAAPAPAAGGGSPVKGTMISADTNEIKNVLREVPRKTPPKQSPARKTSEPTKQLPPGWSRRWSMLAGLNVCLLALLGMWAGGVFKASTEKKSAEPPNAIANSIGMKFVLVKPGVFRMGSPKGEANRCEDEHLHEVEITQPFYVGIHEVTQEQYQRIMGENPSWFSPKGGGKKEVLGMATSELPVENVSWQNADKFCRCLSELPEEKLQGRAYRLPTEAEWEYCCRGGHLIKSPSPVFHFGHSLSSTHANFDGHFPYPRDVALEGPFLERTARVGSYSPNSLGLYDLHGNVWEWCADWYDANFYTWGSRRDPQGPGNGNGHVLRGGSWFDTGMLCRTAFRQHYTNGTDRVGFRVVFDVRVRP